MEPAGAAARPRPFLYRRRRGLGYEEAMALQEEHLARLKADRQGPGLLLAVEHAPIITLGRLAERENLLASPEAIAAAGVALHQARRGGDVTYHGPGQVTLYPVLPLEWWERDLHRYLRRLEAVGLAYLAGHGLAGERLPGLTGVWVGGAKVMAIGVAVSAWIAYYGLAMNIDPAAAHFRLIRPCGIGDRPVTSLARLTGRSHAIEAEMDRLAEAFCTAFPGAELLTEDV